MTTILKYPASLGFIALSVVLLQVFLPIASDEAYFIAWGKSLAPGFYDHPPLTGWISYLLRGLGDLVGLAQQGLIHRSFSLALAGASLWLVARRLRAMNVASAPALLTLALIPGFLLMSNTYLNDTLVAFFALVFVLAVDNAMRARRNVWAAILMAGLAFAALLLTKYNGAVVYLGLLLALLTWPQAWRFLFGRMVLISLVALGPFLAHLWWNWLNCSVNLAFNFGFRAGEATGWGPLYVLLTILVMAGPAGFLALWVAPKVKRFGFFSRVFLATLLVMLVISIWRGEFGVNWGTPLAGMAVLALAELRPQAFDLARRAGLALAALTVLPIAFAAMALDMDVLKVRDFTDGRAGFAADLVLDINTGALPDLVRPLAEGRVLVSQEYGVGAGFDNAGFPETTVFAKTIFGRNQDLLTDFRTLDGRDMVIVPFDARADQVLAKALFDSYEIVTIRTERQSYEMILGRGFSYASYRKGWILPVITGLYDQSPFPFGACYMDKYRTPG
jgi:4-amino-4-deoxy-L-arabinose transferase-like glycosyltransferase